MIRLDTVVASCFTAAFAYTTYYIITNHTSISLHAALVAAAVVSLYCGCAAWHVVSAERYIKKMQDVDHVVFEEYYNKYPERRGEDRGL